MEIIVSGTARKKFKPETIIINLTFSNKENDYNKCLEKGAKMVDEFVKKVLTALDIKKEDMKTTNFNIREQMKYLSNKRVFDGYMFTQNSHIEIDYDVKKLSKFMDMVSKLDTPPSYRTTFGLKQEDERRTEVIAMAIGFAKDKALAISKASGKELVDLVKVDFRPFSNGIIGNSSINSYDMYTMNEEASFGGNLKMCKTSGADMIENNFTPEDIEISETLYCLYLAK